MGEFNVRLRIGETGQKLKMTSLQIVESMRGRRLGNKATRPVGVEYGRHYRQNLDTAGLCGGCRGQGICRMPVELFSNQDEVELFYHGVNLGVLPVGAYHKVVFEVSFVEGNNLLRAVSAADKTIERHPFFFVR